MGKPGGYYDPPAIAGGTDLITQGSRLKVRRRKKRRQAPALQNKR